MINGHGDDAFRYKDIRLNFSSNVYNHFDHHGLFNHLAGCLRDVTSYPEPSPKGLESELAKMLCVNASEVMATSGATEAIYLIAQAFRRSKTAILQPTFAEYADACRLHEHQVANICTESTNTLPLLPPSAEMVWLCNPNNPTGSVMPREALLQAIQDHPHTMFVVDASYAPFTAETLLTAAEAVAIPNVIMLHSMTKEFAVPGLRIGYITASETAMERLRLQRMPWAVNTLAIKAGHYLVEHRSDYYLDLNKLMAERERVAKALTALGVIDVWPSQTHILLCRLRFGKASALKDYLATEWGILVRDASNFHSLDEAFFRIAVQSPEENDELLNAIGEWIAC